MFSIIISDFEPIRHYIRNGIKQHFGFSHAMVVNDIKELTNQKIDSLINEFGNVSLFFDLDEKPRLINSKSKIKRKTIFDVMNALDRKSSVSLFVLGSEPSFLENKNAIINHNVQSYQMLSKPFNGQQLSKFINVNLGNAYGDKRVYPTRAMLFAA
ncbi:hypothetical protein [Vibrio fluminensis]|uniref:hypothetical protein n=1 Tax=Vibrio fluminensis TaxID=2783614 RepID=UPI0018877D5D|nr:hypothetical protein [Vibrio fluminensis]